MRTRYLKACQKDTLIYLHQPEDIFYLTGAQVSRGVLIIHPKRSVLFLDPRYKDTYGKILDVDVCSDEEKEMKNVISELSFSKIILNPNTLTYTEYQKALAFAPGKEIDHSQPVWENRLIKDNQEIVLMRMAADLASKGIHYLEEILHPGVTELDLALQFEIFIRERGASGSSFTPIIAFGEGAADPHHRPTKRKLANQEAVIIDAGVKMKDYCSDLTKSLWFGDAPSEEYQKMEAMVTEALDLVIEMAKPGITLRSLSDAVQNFFKQRGVLSLFKHSLGHSIGLSVHEWPTVSPTAPTFELKPGMIFCLEPGLYLQGKWGIRKEEMVLVTEAGGERMSSLSIGNDFI